MFSYFSMKEVYVNKELLFGLKRFDRIKRLGNGELPFNSNNDDLSNNVRVLLYTCIWAHVHVQPWSQLHMMYLFVHKDGDQV